MKAIVGGTVIDGTGRDPVADGVALIEGERITQVGRRGHVSYPPDAEVIDVTGQTVLPGLIDCHDHLASLGYDMASRLGLTWHPSYRVFLVAQVLRQTLEAGFTTVRDAGGLSAGMKLAVEDGLIPGPRLIVSLSIISPTGGIADRTTPSGLTPPEELGLPGGVADGVEAVRRKVRELVRHGADVIKASTTGG
ncbi:MAG: amidohydrolase family protein, partial [Dehalococcoidia bacterium]